VIGLRSIVTFLRVAVKEIEKFMENKSFNLALTKGGMLEFRPLDSNTVARSPAA
jgi:hypothetical protein